jgi:hypothetical protein
MAAAAFRGGSAIDHRTGSYLYKAETCLTSKEAASKGGCSHDWLPHISNTDQHPAPAPNNSYADGCGTLVT